MCVLSVCMLRSVCTYILVCFIFLVTLCARSRDEGQQRDHKQARDLDLGIHGEDTRPPNPFPSILAELFPCLLYFPTPPNLPFAKWINRPSDRNECDCLEVKAVPNTESRKTKGRNLQAFQSDDLFSVLLHQKLSLLSAELGHWIRHRPAGSLGIVTNRTTQ